MRTLEFVGPKGYSHGWVFHGIPGVTPHHELLTARSEARAAHPAGHPERLKAENAVRKSRKLGMHTKSVEPGQEAASKMETTPGEGPRGLEPPVLDSEGRLAGTLPMNAETTDAMLKDVAARKAAKAPKYAGIHPDDITASAEPTKHTSYNHPNSRMMRQGARSTQYEEWKTSLRHGDKHLGVVGTHAQHGTSQLYLGNKEVYLSGGDPQFTALTAHYRAVEKAKGRVAAEVNARRARAALSAAGMSAVKSHSTSVRGWKNYDPGHEVSAHDTGVRVEHYNGSSLMRTNAEERIAKNLEAYARRLEEKGFVVDRVMQDGKLVSLNIPNEKQGRPGLKLSAETPALAATPAPLGKPGGPGLYHMKGAKLPNYIENMRNALMRGGMSEGRATATAINACKRLAATSKHPEVKAAAAAAIAELKATAARAKAMSRDDVLARPVELFNTMHVGAGASTGGQFAPKAGGGGAAATKTPAKKAPGQKTAPPASGKKGRKAAMLTKARGLQSQARGLEVKIGGLQKELKGITNSGKSTTHGGSKATGTTTKGKTAAKAKKSATTVAKKAGKATTKKATSTASSSGKTRADSLRQQIGQLQVQVRQLRGRASSLILRARAL
jgi:hypothetical protein